MMIENEEDGNKQQLGEFDNSYLENQDGNGPASKIVRKNSKKSKGSRGSRTSGFDQQQVITDEQYVS